MTLRYLGASAFRGALPMQAAIDALEEVFRAAADGRALAPERGVVSLANEVPRAPTLMLTMPAGWRDVALGAKVSSFIADNPARGRAAVQGVGVLLDADTGAPVLIVDAAALTVRRTAAMVGLATGALAAPSAASLGVIGTGALAADMIDAVRCVRPIETVRLFNRTPARAQALATTLDIDAVVVDTADAAAACDVVVLATSSTQPVISAGAVRDGAHLNAVGNFSPTGREVPGETMARGAIWVDEIDAVLAEAGDLLLAAQEGLIAPGRAGVCGDLGTLLTTPPAARVSGERQLTVFKSVGTAIADLGAMCAALRSATADDLGVVLPTNEL